MLLGWNGQIKVEDLQEVNRGAPTNQGSLVCDDRIGRVALNVELDEEFGDRDHILRLDKVPQTNDCNADLCLLKA